MKNTIKFILSTLLLLSTIFSSVCLSIDNGNLNYSSTDEVYGFQFSHNGCASEASGGDAEANGFTVSASSTTVLGFSLSGSFIPAGYGTLVTGVNCDTIDNLVFSGPVDGVGGLSLDITLADDCSLNIPEINFPLELEINNVYPNPFNPICNINYSVPNYGFVKVALFDVNGRKLQMLVNQIMQKGNYDLTIDGNHLTSGIYFVSINYNEKQIIRKISLIK